MPNPKTSEKSNYIDREENLTRGLLSAKRVVIYTYDAATDTLVPGGDKVVTERYDIQGTTIYTGSAIVGTTDSSTGWTINKYVLTDLTDASGKVATDVSWDDRATGSYA
jgi:hypothetical protein